MGKRLFDNLLKVIKGRSTFTTTTIISLEVDFELPRGFVAKVAFIEMVAEKISEDLEAQNIDIAYELQMALIRDPDDTTTIEIPVNQVQHDVIMEHKVTVVNLQGTAESALAVSETLKKLDFSSEGNDLITARNMRFNIVTSGPGPTLATEGLGSVHIYYTLEKVTDIDILNLLDIL